MNEKITFNRLVELVAEASSTSKRMSELFLRELFAIVTQALADGESVKIKGIGTFSLNPISARKSVNVNSKEVIEIPDHNRVVFEPDKALADAINMPFAQFKPMELNIDVTDEQLDAIALPDSPEASPVTEEPAPEQEPENDMEVEEEMEAEVEDDSIVDTNDAVEEEPEAEVEAAPQPLFVPQEPEVEPIPVVESEPEPDPEAAVEPDPEPDPEAVVEPAPEPVVVPEPAPEVEPAPVVTTDKGQKSAMWKGFALGVLTSLVVALLAWFIFHPSKSGDKNAADSTTAVTEQTQAAELSTEEPAAPAVVTDTITPKNPLMSMAKKHYGNEFFYVYIFEENSRELAAQGITSPNNVKPGTVLTIPPREKYGIDPADKESVKQAQIKSIELMNRK